MYTLGINAVFHDSAACILKDGILLAAAEDERFTHIKHGKRPVPAPASFLQEFKKITGVPVLVNTSFNTLGKPIVCSPRDAIECFWTSPFDALIIGSFLIEKECR